MLNIKEAIKNEIMFHDEYDVINLEEQVDYLFNKNKLKEAESLVEEFCNYTLPDDACVGGEWNLPNWYIFGNDSPNAPVWDFTFPEFTAYIKAVKQTKDPNVLEIEYWLYRANNAHCNGYYQYWDNGKAMIDVKSHRRWDVK